MINNADRRKLFNKEWILILLVSVIFFIVYLKYIFDGNMYAFRDMGSDCRDQFSTCIMMECYGFGKEISPNGLSALSIGFIYDNFATVSERETIEISRSEKSIITDCLNELKNGDPNYYRVEKNIDIDSALGDPLYLSYHPATGYCSTINKYVTEFLQGSLTVCRNSMVNRADGYFTSDEMDNDSVMSLLGVKYIIADKDCDQLSK